MILEEQKAIRYNDYKLNDRQVLVMNKIATFGAMTQKMIALYFAVYYPENKDKLQAVRNTAEQLIKKNLIKKTMLGNGEYRLIYTLKNKGKIVTKNEGFYYIKANEKIYQSSFRHFIISSHISIFTELLKKEKTLRLIHENQIRKMKFLNKWKSDSIPDFLLATKEQKSILIEYEKNLKNDPRKLVEKLINFKTENLKSIKNGVENIYYFVGTKRKAKKLNQIFLRADEIAKEYQANYQTYVINRSKIKIKSIEEVQEIFIKKYNCEELRSQEIYKS